MAGLLASPEIKAFVAVFEQTGWAGSPGYPIRTMVGIVLAKSLYAIPTWRRTVALVREHAALRAAISATEIPSEWACYRFCRKLREHGDMLSRCIDGVIAGPRAENPDM